MIIRSGGIVMREVTKCDLCGETAMCDSSPGNFHIPTSRSFCTICDKCSRASAIEAETYTETQQSHWRKIRDGILKDD